jgi:type II secretory pathway pseudopilin PulG
MLSGGRRPGVSLIEVVVAMVMLLALAAAVLPTAIRPNDRERMRLAVEELDMISAALQAMRADNQDWPRRIRQLSHPITRQDTNICGSFYQQGKVNSWLRSGPYIDRVVPPAGLHIGIGVVQDSIIRVPANASGPGGSQIASMIIVIEGVTEEDAIELNRQIDADDSGTGGAIRWSVDAANGMARVEYARPIKGC